MPPLTPVLRDRLASVGRVRTVRRGERLIHEGLSGGAVALVLGGTLRITRVCGDTEVVLAVRGPGDLVGELGSMTGTGAGATVEARESGRVSVMSSSKFLAAQRGDPEIAAAVLSRLVELLDVANRRLSAAQCRPLTCRLADEIIHLASLNQGGSSDAAEGFLVTQSELASLCLASRSAVADSLSELRSRGAIETGRAMVKILDQEGLELLAEDTRR